jgi:hypothetical protein
MDLVRSLEVKLKAWRQWNLRAVFLIGDDAFPMNPRLLNTEHLPLLQSTSAHHGHSLPITDLKSARYIIKADSTNQTAF